MKTGGFLIAAGALIIFIAPPSAALAQVTGSNVVDAQSGNIPFTDPENRFDLYDQLNLDYLRDGLRLGIRFETSRNSENLYEYGTLTQRYAEWNDPRGRIRVGNFTTILGRGLVHRSFELPGVVLDQPGLRSRYAPTRDVDGVLVEGERGSIRALAFSGTPSGGDVSPGLDGTGIERYRGQISGAGVSARLPRYARLGVTYARVTDDGDRQEEMGSGFLDADPLALIGVTRASLPVYVEYAQRGATFGDWWSFRTGDDDPHALYAGMNLIVDRVALSAEWKDYAGFRLGTNDSPSLVREHSRPLLNRATHLLNATLEEGYQLEASWSFADWGDLVLNQSRSDGSFGVRDVRFDERFAEVRIAPEYGARWDLALFYDEGKDEFAFVTDRELYGASATLRVTRSVAVTADLERQHAVRTDASLTDTYYAISVSVAGLGSAALVLERTDDPFEEDPENALTPPVQVRSFLGMQVSARLSDRHELLVFAGERRGGRACTAGTCYEVLAFRGVEARLTSRF